VLFEQVELEVAELFATKLVGRTAEVLGELGDPGNVRFLRQRGSYCPDHRVLHQLGHASGRQQGLRRVTVRDYAQEDPQRCSRFSRVQVCDHFGDDQLIDGEHQAGRGSREPMPEADAAHRQHLPKVPLLSGRQ
jgi:hypothetical protein